MKYSPRRQHKARVRNMSRFVRGPETTGARPGTRRLRGLEPPPGEPPPAATLGPHHGEAPTLELWKSRSLHFLPIERSQSGYGPSRLSKLINSILIYSLTSPQVVEIDWLEQKKLISRIICKLSIVICMMVTILVRTHLVIKWIFVLETLSLFIFEMKFQLLGYK